MYYKGFEIKPQYLPGSDFKILLDGRIVNRKPTEIDFYTITEIETGWNHVNATSYNSAKKIIDELMEVLSSASN